MNRVIRAIEQMQSKGQVMSEELKLQLGDVVPGAIKLFAKAMGVTTEQFLELSKQGKVSSAILSDVADVINKDFEEAIRLGSQSTRSQLNRLSTGFFMLRNSVGNASEEVFGIRDKLGRFGDWLTNTAGDLDKLNSSGKKTLFWIGAFLTLLGPGAVAIKLIAKAFMIWKGGLLFLFTPFGKIFKLFGKFFVFAKWIRANPLLFRFASIFVLIRALKILKNILKLSPWGLLITAAFEIYNHWDKVVDVFNKAIQKAKEFFGIGKKEIVDEKALARSRLEKTLNPELASSALSKLGVPQQTLIPQQSMMNSNNTINQNLSFAPGTSSKDKDAIKGAVAEANQDIMKNMLFQARLQE